MERRRTQMSVRFPEDLHGELEAFAEETDRSLNGAVNWLLRAALRAEDSVAAHPSRHQTTVASSKEEGGE